MKRIIATIGIGVAILAFATSPALAQRYKYPPGPAYRTCPDTLTIFDVQQPDTLLAPCHPATLDTVWGVGGIITGFDARASAYAIYYQNTFSKGALGWTGVNVFTGATNYNGAPFNLAVGDSIVVYGTTQEFPNPNGETEVEGPDTIQGTNDIVVRKVSSGNALPPFHIGTTAELNWIPAISGLGAEQWEGCLVKINGPLKVARITGTGLQGNNFLIVNPAAASDTVMIDGFTLMNPAFGTPPLGSTIGFVQGILNQRTGNGVNSYRIQLRDANDINVDAPPNLSEAYPLEDNKLRLIFDKNLDESSAEDIGNYSLGSGIDGSTVDVATLVGGAGTTVELIITSVRNDGDAETITAQNIGTATCPLCLSSSQTLGFAQGVLTVAMLQAPDPANLGTPCDDRSRFAGAGTAFGTRVTVRGVGVQAYGSLHYIADAAGGPRSGISIFGPTSPPVAGRTYRIACRVQEFAGETEIVQTVDILDEGPASLVTPAKTTVAVLADTTCDPSQSNDTGEDWEGVLIEANQVRVVNFNTPPLDPGPGGSFRVVQPAYPVIGGNPDTILVSSLGGHYTYDPTEGDKLDVTGVLHMDNTSFRILPRSEADIFFKKNVGVEDGLPIELALRVSPNPGSAQRVTFALPKAGDVDLAIFDVSGRRVATIARGPFPAGTVSLGWNGADSRGRTVGAGMYFYRLRFNQEEKLVRAVKIN